MSPTTFGLYLITIVVSSASAASIVKCANGGTLLEDGTCLCDIRYEGPTCEEEPCLNGGIKNDGQFGAVVLLISQILQESATAHGDGQAIRAPQ